MRKRHQASRRRTYGRRQHEIHERRERIWTTLEELEDGREAGVSGVDISIRELGLPAYGLAYLAAE